MVCSKSEGGEISGLSLSLCFFLSETQMSVTVRQRRPHTWTPKKRSKKAQQKTQYRGCSGDAVDVNILITSTVSLQRSNTHLFQSRRRLSRSCCEVFSPRARRAAVLSCGWRTGSLCQRRHQRWRCSFGQEEQGAYPRDLRCHTSWQGVLGLGGLGEWGGAVVKDGQGDRQKGGAALTSARHGAVITHLKRKKKGDICKWNL